jgi:Na+/H+ antiporter NhaC
MALCVSTVVCGAMFGDNLSMISDTTIAAVRTQGCNMRDKFKMNFLIVLPAAIITAIIFYVLTVNSTYTPDDDLTYNVLHILPYLFVLIGALLGINIFLVLIIGTVAAICIGVGTGMFPLSDSFSVIGTGINGMYDITVISVVVCCIGSLIKEGGGIQAVLDFVRSRAKTKKGAQLGIAALVAGVDVATANNTIAIVMAGPIAKDISQEFHIDPRRTASLLDIFASVIQGILPYGAQLLYASAQTGISSLEIVPFLYYPLLMAVSAILFILFAPDKSSAVD